MQIPPADPQGEPEPESESDSESDSEDDESSWRFIGSGDRGSGLRPRSGCFIWEAESG